MTIGVLGMMIVFTVVVGLVGLIAMSSGKAPSPAAGAAALTACLAAVALVVIGSIVTTYLSMQGSSRVAGSSLQEQQWPIDLGEPALASDDLDKPLINLDKGKAAEPVPLPDWVTNPPKRVGKTVRLVLETGPYTDAASARKMADEHIWVVANRYAADVSPLVDDRMTLRGADGATNFSRAELRSRLIRDEHLETVDASFGEMKTLHTLVEISPADGKWLVATRDQAKRAERLQAVSMIAAGVLGLVGLAFGLLKADELTRGYYTKRLLVGVPVAIVVLAFLASFLIAEEEAVRLAPPAPADGYRLDR